MFLTVAMLLGMTATTVLAQQGRTELRGRVTDAQGGALPGVSITHHQPGHRHVPPDRHGR